MGTLWTESLPLVVAEISSNHGGDFRTALDLISAAKSAGCGAVKFQALDAEALCVDSGYVIEDGPWEGYKLQELYRLAQTPRDWWPSLFAHARACEIQLFASVFDEGGLRILEELGCPLYKVASFELVDHQLLRAIARTSKPVLLSTGMASPQEIDAAMQVLSQVVVECMACVSAYPSRASDANLVRWSSVDVWGCSDHSQGVGVSAAAAALGATIIERHLTLDRGSDTLDAAFSLTPDELALCVQTCQDAYAATHGDVDEHAQDSCKKLRRSLYVHNSIAAGERFTEYHVGSYRPATGLPCSAYPRVMRARASRDIVAPCALTEDMVDG